MKKFTNRQIYFFIGLLYFVPIALGILGTYLEWSIAGKLIIFGIYLQGVIVISFVIYLLIMFLRKFW